MAEQQAVDSAGEMMVFGLIEQADRSGKSALATEKHRLPSSKGCLNSSIPTHRSGSKTLSMGSRL